ncbi:MAG: hypothetical protein ACHP79_12950, partial [Terriglobales bacterium]
QFSNWQIAISNWPNKKPTAGFRGRARTNQQLAISNWQLAKPELQIEYVRARAKYQIPNTKYQVPKANLPRPLVLLHII